MNIKKRDLIVILFLAAVFLLALLDAVDGCRQRPERKIVKKPGNSSPQEAFDYDAASAGFDAMAWGRDPFGMSAAKRINSSGAGCLKGILLGGGEPTIIVGNQFLKRGSDIEKYKIIEINKDYVILSDGSNVYNLRLGECLQDVK